MIKEAAARLSTEDKNNINRIFPEIMVDILGKNNRKERYIDTFTTDLFSGGKIVVYVYIIDDERIEGALAYFDTNDENDGFIVLQRQNIRNHIYGMGYSVGEATTFLKSVFTHELIHAKDFIIRDEYDEGPYIDPNVEGSYVKIKDEVVAFTSQLYEVLNDIVNEAVTRRDPRQVDEVVNFLKEIIGFYSRLKPLSDRSARLLDDIGSKKTLEFIQIYIGQVRRYNEKGYRALLKNVYDMVTKFKERLESI